MPNKVAITGMGLVSALGINVQENYSKLKEGRTGLDFLKSLQCKHTGNLIVGEVNKSNEELQLLLGNRAQNQIYTRTALLGALAAKEATAHINILDGVSTGFISATSVAGMDKTEKHYYDYHKYPETRKYISTHQAGDSTQKIATYLGIKNAFVSTISTACSSSANAIMLGARLIKQGKLERVIVGGADCLSRFTINGFNSLMILSDTYCQPFDQERKGLNLGEGAAYLVLESENQSKKYNRKPLAYIEGYGNANDAFHQTASSANGEGAYLAMQTALRVAQKNANEIDTINAHGTATTNNDLSELKAIKRIFQDKVPPFTSTKSYTGHTLAAAGAIEAVMSILSLHKEEIFPTLNHCTPMEEGCVPVKKLMNKKVKSVLSNSFGFGGNCSSIILSHSHE